MHMNVDCGFVIRRCVDVSANGVHVLEALGTLRALYDLKSLVSIVLLVGAAATHVALQIDAVGRQHIACALVLFYLA